MLAWFASGFGLVVRVGVGDLRFGKSGLGFQVPGLGLEEYCSGFVSGVWFWNVDSRIGLVTSKPNSKTKPKTQVRNHNHNTNATPKHLIGTTTRNMNVTLRIWTNLNQRGLDQRDLRQRGVDERGLDQRDLV